MTIRLGSLVVSWGLLGLVLALLVWAGRPPPPKGADAAADAFSAGRAMGLLRGLLADETPHPAGSPANARVRQRIVEKLRAIGYQPEVCHASFQSGRQPPIHVENLVCRLPGQHEGPAVMLVAHYDSAPAGPGAADDGSGVAIVLEVARILKAEGPLRNPIVFLITDGEEVDLVGARAFVNDHPLAKEIAAVVNLEARGTGGRSLMFETSEDNGWLIAAYASAVPSPDTSSLYFEVYRRLRNDTDLSIFKRAGMAGLNFAFIQNSAYYHTAQDSLDHLDLGSLQHQGDNALAMIRALAATDLSNPPPGNAVYTDLLGLMVIRWPESWCLPWAVLTSLLTAATVFRLVYARIIPLRSVLGGLAVVPALLAASVLAGIGLNLCLSGRLVSWQSDSCHPALVRAGLWSEVAIVALALTFFASRWIGCWALWSGVWIWWSLAALVVSVRLPGASYLFLLPLSVASVAGVAAHCSRLRDRAWSTAAVVLVPALVAALLWLKSALGIEDALGLGVTPAITVPLALVMATMAPIWLPRENAGNRMDG